MRLEEYEVSSIISSGRFGDVRVMNPKLKPECKCAWKSIMKGKIEQASSHEKLEAENKASSGETLTEIKCMFLTIGHPNIVQFFRHFEDRDSFHVIMEFCPEGNLFNFIQSKKVVREEIATQIIRQVAAALCYCHSLGIVHRDVKPENILISTWAENRDGVQFPLVKLGDFGSSIILKPNEGSVQGLAGTLNYMAPELIIGKAYGTRVDIWSLGIILYPMLTGVFPLNYCNKEGMKKNLMGEKIQFDGDRWRGVSLEAIDLVKWMLQKDPSKRASAQDVLNHPWVSKAFS